MGGKIYLNAKGEVRGPIDSKSLIMKKHIYPIFVLAVTGLTLSGCATAGGTSAPAAPTAVSKASAPLSNASISRPPNPNAPTDLIALEKPEPITQEDGKICQQIKVGEPNVTQKFCGTSLEWKILEEQARQDLQGTK